MNDMMMMQQQIVEQQNRMFEEATRIHQENMDRQMIEESIRIHNSNITRKTSNSNSTKPDNFDEYTNYINEIREKVKRQQSKFEENRKAMDEEFKAWCEKVDREFEGR